MQRLKGRGVQDRAVVFLHIPKTAGTTLASILYREYVHDRIFYFGSWPNIEEGLKQFTRLPEGTKTRYEVFLGHQPFGLHAYLPKRATYITLIRDPVERVISHYYHRYRKKHPDNHELTALPLITADDYVVSDSFWHNWQCRFLQGPPDIFPGNGDSQEMLDTVKRNIERQAMIVGLTERFDESVVLFKLALGWDSPCYMKMNVGLGRPRKQDLSADALCAIEDSNKLDIALYAFVKERFREEIRSLGPLFDEELNRFRDVQERYLQDHSGALGAGSDDVFSWFLPSHPLSAETGKARNTSVLCRSED